MVLWDSDGVRLWSQHSGQRHKSQWVSDQPGLKSSSRISRTVTQRNPNSRNQKKKKKIVILFKILTYTFVFILFVYVWVLKFILFFETVSCSPAWLQTQYVVRDNSEFLILLPQPPSAGWHYTGFEMLGLEPTLMPGKPSSRAAPQPMKRFWKRYLWWRAQTYTKLYVM